MDSPFAPRSPVNLGNDNEITIRELAEIVIDLTGSASQIKHLPLPKDDPKRRRPDTSLALKTLGWAPKVSLTEGLRRTVAYHEETLARPDALKAKRAA
jgi:UDP-glucuronate decarboxylase